MPAIVATYIHGTKKCVCVWGGGEGGDKERARLE